MDDNNSFLYFTQLANDILWCIINLAVKGFTAWLIPPFFLNIIMRLRSSLRGSHKEFEFVPNLSESKDINSYLRDIVKDKLISNLRDVKSALQSDKSIKFSLHAESTFEKYDFNERKSIVITTWFRTDTYNILTSAAIFSYVDEAVELLLNRCEAFMTEGSGWLFKTVNQVLLKIDEYVTFSGACSKSELPVFLQKKRCCFTVEGGERDKCFLYAVAAAVLNPKKKHPKRLRVYESFIRSLSSNEFIKFPVRLPDVVVFENANDISVNIFTYEDNVLCPTYVTKCVDKSRHVNLLLYNNHYFAITNLSAMLSSVRNSRRKKYICYHCLSYFNSAESLNTHSLLCKKTGQVYQMGSRGSHVYFNRYDKVLEADFVIYCDLESIIGESIPSQDATTKLISHSLHTPISVGAYTVCRANINFGSSSVFIYTGIDCIEKLFNYLDAEFTRIQMVSTLVNEDMIMTAQDQYDYEKATKCYLCGKLFSTSVSKYRDHCHLSGKFRCVLCNRCNFTSAKRKTGVYVVFHGLSNYDSHFLVQKLHRYNSQNISIIPKSSEKFLSFSVGQMQFIDSFQFLQESLSTLVCNLVDKGEKYFTHVNRHISDPKHRSLFMRKGVFPYSYLSVSRMRETEIPPRSAFYNDLTNKELSDEDYAFACRVWKVFDCQNLQEYMELYLQADVLLLADVFENFRTNCHYEYDLEPLYYFSTPHFTFDAFLRFSGCRLELLTDVNHYLFLSRAIRGGISMICKRFAVANNPYLKHFDSSKLSKYILYLDANNLYGCAMREFLPYAAFRWMTEEELESRDYLTIGPKSIWGCFVEVDLDYPKELHDLHADYPLAPEKRTISLAELSPYARRLLSHINRGKSVEKLMNTLYPKKNYVVHYRLLQLYLKLGLVLTKVHRGIFFHQAPIMRDYVDYNSEKRSQATNAFDIGFYKLLSNSLFGKTIERPENRLKIHLVDSRVKFEKLVAKLTFKNAQIINENLCGVQMKQAVLKLTKPFYIGIAILELAKFHMYNFHYNVIKKNYGDRIALLMTDTDSFLYQITTDDLYKDLQNNTLLQGCFDFSNYPQDHVLYNVDNKRRPGYFKDERHSEQIKKFVGLRSKMYSILMDNDTDQIVAKGVHGSVRKNVLRFGDYLSSLRGSLQLEHSFNIISSKKHRVYTNRQSKISLSPFDDKRYLLDHKRTIPFGHYTIQ